MFLVIGTKLYHRYYTSSQLVRYIYKRRYSTCMQTRMLTKITELEILAYSVEILSTLCMNVG